MPTPDAPPPGRSWSREPATAWALLAIALPVGGYLVAKLARTTGLAAPRFWDLLRDEPVFGLAMLDFFLTAGWAALVLIERSRARDWRFWLSLAAFCVIPTVGIALFILLDRGKGRGSGEMA